MPIYEYKCGECGNRFDVLQRVGQDGSELECPSCGSKRPEKMLSSFASTMGGDNYCPSSTSGNCSSRGYG